MGMGIDIIEVKFKGIEDLDFFSSFFDRLSKGQIPNLDAESSKYIPVDYINRVLTFLGYGWCFVPDTPHVERLEINQA